MRYRQWCGPNATLHTVADRIAAVTGSKVSHVTVHKWLNGTYNPTWESIEKLAATFEVTESWLLFGE